MLPFERRRGLIERMNKLEEAGMACNNCQGTCCTYEANSMMVTPVEAVELAQYLKSQNQFDEELKKRLTENVSKFRLDQSLGNGKRSFIRRTYTCPFFNHKELGCPLPREVKPFGCLAFNSHHQELKAGEHCFSETDILEAREKNAVDEVELNQKFQKEYSLWWEKTSLPVALLDLFNKI